MLVAISHPHALVREFAWCAPAAWATFQPGDHVRVWRGTYWHHAIYAGNGLLIEFGSGLLGGVVAYVKWEAFARGETASLVRRGSTVVLNRARERVGRGGFHLLTANCEHFATWCSTGRWESTQADTFKLLAGLSLFVLIAKFASK